MGRHEGPEPLLTFDWGDYESVDAAVVDALGAVTGTPATELEPLYESVDPDALVRLFPEPDDRGPPLAVAFSVAGLWVHIDERGEGRVYE